MESKSVIDTVRSLFGSIQDYYDWRRRTLLTQAYFFYKRDSIIKTSTPAGTIELEVNPKWGRAFNYATGKRYEPLLLNRLYKDLSSDSVFYNIGARWGIFSIFAEACGVEPSNVHSFEADEGAFEILQKNVSNQHNINNVYISDTDKGKNVTLDSYVSGKEVPTVMKIDIEGAELKALRGAETLLNQEKPELLIEVHPRYIKEMGGTQHDLISLLSSSGYDLEIARTDSDESTFEPIDRNSLPENPTHGNYRLLAV